MLEVCESIAGGRPRLEVHPLSIGGKDDPVRLVFDAHPGPAVARLRSSTWAQRFRMVATRRRRHRRRSSRCRGCPVARAVWRPRPDLQTQRRRLDPCRRLAPHEPRLSRSTAGAPAPTSRRCPGSSSSLIDETTELDGVPRPAPLERPLLPPRARPLSVDRHVFPARAGPGSPPTVRPAITPASSAADPCHRGRSRRRARDLNASEENAR